MKDSSFHHEHYRALMAIAHISHQISAQSLPYMLGKSLDILLQLDWLKVEQKGCIFVLDQQFHRLYMVAERNLSSSLLGMCQQLALGRCLCGKVAESKTMLFKDSIDADHENMPAGIKPHGHLVMPILLEDRMLGVLNLYVQHGHVLDEETTMFLQAVCGLLANLIHLSSDFEYLSHVTQSMSEGLLEIDSSSVIKRVNVALCHLLGYQQAELLGRQLQDLFEYDAHEDELFAAKMLTQAAEKMQESYDLDDRNFFRIMDIAPYAVLKVDTEGLICSFNQRAEKIFGYSSGEVIGQAIHLLVPDSIRVNHEAMRHRFMMEQRSMQMSDRQLLHAQRKDGSEFVVKISLLMLKNRRGERRILVIVRDEELDPPWYVIKATPFGQLFYSDKQNEEFSLQNLIAKDGHKVSVIVSGMTNENNFGGLKGASLVINDMRKYAMLLEEKQKAEKVLELEQHKRLESLGLMAGGIAHDFNNLLTPIVGNIEMLMKGQPADSKPLLMMKQILDAAMQASRLSRQMLSYSGSGRINATIIDLSAVIEKMEGVLIASVAENVQLHFDLDHTLPEVQVDIVEIEQILHNMVINAADALQGARGNIDITTQMISLEEVDLQQPNVYCKADVTPGNYVAFKVQDDGCGMSEAVQARIFDPFFTTKFTGRGLGMSAVLGIVYSHQGVLTVDSIVGEGSTFTVAFRAMNLASKAREAGAVEAKVAELLSLQATVLIVDDDPLVSAVLSARLHELNCHSMLAGHGQEGLDIYAQARDEVDLVILDMTMPVMSGSECFFKLVEMNPDVKVVISSGYSGDDIQAQVGHHPALIGLLPKPYSMNDLAQVVRQALG
ncbi:MAG: PAS domain S-box protein [Zetaproteobacteria bacterium]|nr:PAS domain S-box protein [Zetaproteobacteria bacterium]